MGRSARGNPPLQSNSNSNRSEVLYNILIECGVPTKIFRLIEMCLNEMYSKVRIDKYLSDSFPVQVV
jgi:hypothetical protein